MYAADFRLKARNSLKNKWGLAVGVGIVADVLSGGIGAIGDTSGGDATGQLRFANHEAMIVAVTTMIAVSLLVFIVSGAVNLGLSRFHLDLVSGKEAKFSTLFSQFYRLWTGVAMNLVLSFFVFLWSLLLVVPGIIAAYRYAMVPYIMAEYPDLRIMEAMNESKRLMAGNKGRLFCLHFSFMGWALLDVMTLGIGSLWLNPYIRTAEAAFYRELAGQNLENGPCCL